MQRCTAAAKVTTMFSTMLCWASPYHRLESLNIEIRISGLLRPPDFSPIWIRKTQHRFATSHRQYLDFPILRRHQQGVQIRLTATSQRQTPLCLTTVVVLLASQRTRSNLQTVHCGLGRHRHPKMFLSKTLLAKLWHRPAKCPHRRLSLPSKLSTTTHQAPGQKFLNPLARYSSADLPTRVDFLRQTKSLRLQHKRPKILCIFRLSSHI